MIITIEGEIMQTQGIPDNSDTIEGLKAQLEQVQKEKELAEKRFKDTQAAYTKGNQERESMKAQIATLQEHLNSIQNSSIDTPEMLHLKATDPDKWYQLRRQAELDAQNKLNSKLSEVGQAAFEAEQKKYNAQLLAEFKARNPDITDEFINYDVPHRIQVKLKEGEISFSEFLSEVEAYHKKGKVVGNVGQQVTNQPDLSKMGTGENVSNRSLDYETFSKEYKNTII